MAFTIGALRSALKPYKIQLTVGTGRWAQPGDAVVQFTRRGVKLEGVIDATALMSCQAAVGYRRAAFADRQRVSYGTTAHSMFFHTNKRNGGNFANAQALADHVAETIGATKINTLTKLLRAEERTY